MTEAPNYAQQYKIVDHCLLETRNSKQGPYDRKLCNFTPWIVTEITRDDGVETTTRIRLRGIHQSGRHLPEIEIPAAELASFNWLAQHWGMDCILEVGQSVKDSVRYAVQTTAKDAQRQTVYAVTGWRRIDGDYHFLMPGDDAFSVTLPGKMSGYAMERSFDMTDIQIAASLLHQPLAPVEILFPLLAFTLLSPLNHFLKLAGCEPKFVLFLVGKTGSRKSTLAALFLSFFGRFTGAELPLSFRDTANSIIHNAFALKDVLTCIDDLHPSSRQEEQRMNATAQAIMRAYGDRTGKGRLRADASPMESRPPQGNAIITAEFAPDIGESGTARYFALELKDGDVNLEVLSYFQRAAADGLLRRCMFAFLEWLKDRFLSDVETEQLFIHTLRVWFTERRDAFSKSGIRCHGRVPETVAWLQLGMDFFLLFLKEKECLRDDECAEIQSRFRMILYRLAAKQAESIDEDKPTHKFIRKLYALIESGQACVLSKNQISDFIPGNCIGYEDADYFYLHNEIVHKAVRKLCEEQGESFTVSSNSLLKALAEEGFIETASGQNTRSVRIGGKSKRVVCLEKQIVIIDGLDEVIRQQKGIGRNLNQLTTLANMGKIKTVYLNELTGQYAQVGCCCDISSRFHS